MITPRALSEKTEVSSSAISQWLKPLVKKGVLNWCDQNGDEFEDEKLLGKAKRSGKAFLYVAGGKSLPTPFQLTRDPEWDRGGDLYMAYDLHLDDIVGDFIDTDMGEEDCHEQEDADPKDAGVKVLSDKSNDDIKKMVKTFRENQKECDPDDPVVMQLVDEFSGILSTENVGTSI